MDTIASTKGMNMKPVSAVSSSIPIGEIIHLKPIEQIGIEVIIPTQDFELSIFRHVNSPKKSKNAHY